MTLFKFADFGDRVYGYLKNLEGEFVGQVSRGAIHDLESAPDWRWVEAVAEKLTGSPESAAEPVSPAPAPIPTPAPAEPSPAVSEPVNQDPPAPFSLRINS